MAGAYLAITSAVFGLFKLRETAWASSGEESRSSPGGAPYPESEACHGQSIPPLTARNLFAYVIGDPRRLLSVAGLPWQCRPCRSPDRLGTRGTRRTGICVMVAEYRGYMGLTGRPSYDCITTRCRRSVPVVRDTFGISPEHVSLFGHSLGTAIATELAARNRPAALILQSPFTSARAMAALMVGNRVSSILWPSISRLHYDTLARVATLDVPVSVAHGGLDRVIPSWMGQAVFAAARDQGRLAVCS